MWGRREFISFMTSSLASASRETNFISSREERDEC